MKTIKIKSDLTEKKVVEYYLNMFFSGYDASFLLFIHALSNKWNINKLFYYLRLRGER